MTRARGLVPHLSRDAWVILGGDFLSAVGSGLTLPFLLVYLNRVRGIDIEVAGLAVSTIALAGFLGNPVGGSASDRIGPRNSLVIGLLCSAAGAASLAFVTEPWHAFGATALQGFGAAVVWPSQDALLASVVETEKRSNVFAVRHATLNAGFGVGGLAAALVVDFSSAATFQTIYLADAATYLAFIPILLLIPSVSGARAGGAALPSGYRAIVKDPAFVRLWVLTALLVTIGYAQTHAAFPAYVTGRGGLPASGLGIVFAANTIAVVGAQLVVLRLAQGRRRTRAVVLLCALWAAAWLVTLAGGVAGGPAFATAIFAGAMVLFALGETLLSPTMPALVNDLAPDELRGRYNGAYTLAWTTGFWLGPVLAGVAFGAGHDRAFMLALVAGCGIAGVAAWRLERHLPVTLNVIGAAGAPEEIGALPPLVDPAGAE